MSPTDFTQIKKRIEDSSMLTRREKEDWLFLLPRMTELQIKELDRILAIRLPNVTEDRKNLRTQEPSSIPLSFSPLSKEEMKEGDKRQDRTRPPLLSPPLEEGKKGEVAELKAIRALTVEVMRRDPSIYHFLEEAAGKKMNFLVKSGKAKPEEVIHAFELSPLYRAYMDQGMHMLEEIPNSKSQISNALNHLEFEAIADFRASLKKIVSS